MMAAVVGKKGGGGRGASHDSQLQIYLTAVISLWVEMWRAPDLMVAMSSYVGANRSDCGFENCYLQIQSESENFIICHLKMINSKNNLRLLFLVFSLTQMKRKTPTFTYPRVN